MTASEQEAMPQELGAERKRTSFKAVANVVLAMRRFSNSLNPTYTYGKRPSSSGGATSKTLTEDAEAQVASSGKHLAPSSTGGRATSPRPNSPEAHDHAKYAYNTHGHKFDFLLKPLPPTDEEELEAAHPPQ